MSRCFHFRNFIGVARILGFHRETQRDLFSVNIEFYGTVATARYLETFTNNGVIHAFNELDALAREERIDRVIIFLGVIHKFLMEDKTFVAKIVEQIKGSHQFGNN